MVRFDSKLLLKSLLTFCLIGQVAPSHSATEQDLFHRYEQAIVKVTVTGKGINNREKDPAEGSGVIIYSKNFTLILTAAHVIGSNSKTSNPDWMVDNGKIARKIQVEGLDSKGALGVLNQDADVLPVQFPDGIDIAVLSIPQRGYSAVLLPKPKLNFNTAYDVMLLGFQKGRRELSAPWQSTSGVPKSSGVFETSLPSRHGESGGAWLDRRNGQLLGVASGVYSTPERTQYSAGYVPLVIGQLQVLFPKNSAEGPRTPPEVEVEDSDTFAQPSTPVDRSQWTKFYLQPAPGTNSPISGSRYGVVVASFDSIDAAKQKLLQLCSKFPNTNFALLGSESPNGGKWQIEAGYNLTGEGADSLVQAVRKLGVAKDAYKRIYGWDGNPANFPDCGNPYRVFPR
ncbi:S1 family peptidase [Bradyrhizobium sp. 23AC]